MAKRIVVVNKNVLVGKPDEAKRPVTILANTRGVVMYVHQSDPTRAVVQFDAGITSNGTEEKPKPFGVPFDQLSVDYVDNGDGAGLPTP